MMVDCHTHIWRSEHWCEEMASEAARVRGRPIPTDIDPAVHWSAVGPVDRAVVFGFQSRHLGVMVPNDIVAMHVSRFPEKLIGFACIEPNDSNYLDEMYRAFEDLAFEGLHLAPVHQNFDPLDSRMRPVYSYCEEFGIPILFHAGTSFSHRAPLKYASPLPLDEIATEYPDLNLVIAQMGQPWIADTVVVIRKHPNVYADVSALHYRPWQFYNALLCAVEYEVDKKLFFGSAYPFATPAEAIAALQNVNHVVEGSNLPRVPDDVVRGILHRDVMQLLRLRSAAIGAGQYPAAAQWAGPP
jgi:predicted TIM-barrel fold metal-dependent hydrolase